MEKDYFKFKVKVKHDKGTKIINVHATNEWSAKNLIMACEGCPGNAILNVTKVKP